MLYDPRPGDGGEIPVLQGAFDPGSNLVLEAKVRELQRRAAGEAAAPRRDAGAGGWSSAARSMALSEELDDLGEDAQAKLAEAVEAERLLREHTVDAFVNGTSG